MKLKKFKRKQAGDVANFIFGREDGIPIKIEIKQEIKNEPMDRAEKVQEKTNRDTLKRAGDVANIIFEHEDGFPMKKERKKKSKMNP